MAADTGQLPASIAGPDPRVPIAFALGWQMAELYRPKRRHGWRAASPEDLPGLGRLRDQEIQQLGVDQVTAGLAALTQTITQASLTPPGISALQSRLTSDEQETRRQAVMELHIELLRVLTAANFRLGKAYGLGRALADTCRNPSNLASVRTELTPFRAATLQKWLDDLGSAFPAHAAHSVSTSLAHWTEWINSGPTGSESESDVLSRLRRQGQLWRALLSGEKQGTDMLEVQNYLDAATCMLRRLRVILLRTLARFPLLTLLVVGLFAGGVVLILAQNTRGSIAAGLAGVVASLGITWKSLGASVSKIAATLEQPLWGAELDAAIVEAITLLPDNNRDHKGRGRLAIRADSDAVIAANRDDSPRASAPGTAARLADP